MTIAILAIGEVIALKYPAEAQRRRPDWAQGIQNTYR